MQKALNDLRTVGERSGQGMVDAETEGLIFPLISYFNNLNNERGMGVVIFGVVMTTSQLGTIFAKIVGILGIVLPSIISIDGAAGEDIAIKNATGFLNGDAP